MPIGGHAFGTVSDCSQGTPKEALRCCHIPSRTQHGILQLPITVDSSI
jgi:hypothetical protein